MIYGWKEGAAYPSPPHYLGRFDRISTHAQTYEIAKTSLIINYPP